MQRGYHVLLEKPMATCEEDCRALVRTSEETGKLLQICHVLRYAPLYATIKQILDAGEIGEVVTIQHSENVSFWHFAHSYCRGHWRNVAQSSPLILAKSCHDLDLLFWFAGAEPNWLASTTRPNQLCESNKPEGAPEYCIEGCPHAASCPYDAVSFYRDLDAFVLDFAHTAHPPMLGRAIRIAGRMRAWLARHGPGWLEKRLRWRYWPVSVMTADTSPAGVDQALRTSRYGRCVYQVPDNDQVSSQSVSVVFDNGVNASFTLNTTSYREGRETRIDGTQGSLRAGFYNGERFIEVYAHKSGETRRERLSGRRAAAHGGGDYRLFGDFLAAVRGEVSPRTTARESLSSHLMAFAADRSQRDGVAVKLSGNI
jgi:predicted dehydrogenase